MLFNSRFEPPVTIQSKKLKYNFGWSEGSVLQITLSLALRHIHVALVWYWRARQNVVKVKSEERAP